MNNIRIVTLLITARQLATLFEVSKSKMPQMCANNCLLVGQITKQNLVYIKQNGIIFHLSYNVSNLNTEYKYSYA